MCGIAAVFGDRAPTRVAELIQRVRHRGPDSAGFYRRDGVQLGAARLRIVDLESGDQPIRNAACDTAIVLNGEIYNFRSLRRMLQQRGYEFATGSDTEVILHLYEEFGSDCVHHLQGMFAFMIADGERVFAARDRLGIKPLFYCRDGDDSEPCLMLASEPAALLKCRRARPELDWQSVIDGLLLGHPMGDRSYFKGIQTLEPGCTMTVEMCHGRLVVDTRRYYAAPALEPDNSLSFDHATRELDSLLGDTVSAHMDADVDVGVLLSGGVDSGLLAAVACAGGTPPARAFTIGHTAFHPDVIAARRIAERLALRHTVVLPPPQDFIAAIPRCIAVMGALHHVGGLPALLLCEAVRHHGLKACLCGEGSDEVFGGYRDFTGTASTLHTLRATVTRFVAAGLVPSDEVFALIDGLEVAKAESREAHLRAIFHYHQRHAVVFNHLEMFDRLGMAASVEIRVPYLDHRLAEFANRLPLHFKIDHSSGTGKYILRHAAAHCSQGVLAEAAWRQKLGMPSAARGPLREFEALCDAMLPADYRHRHELGRCMARNSQLVLFELFEEIFLRHAGVLPGGLDMLEFVRSRAGAVPRVS